MARSATAAIATLLGVSVLLVGACSEGVPDEVRVATSQTAPSSTEALDETTTTLLDQDTTASDTQPSEPTAGPTALVGHYVPVVIGEYPHDPEAWTQGLEWYDDALLESTGLVGQSSLRVVDAHTGIPNVVVASPEDLFAEGVTVVNDEAIQITYQDRVTLRTPLLPDAAAPGQTVRIDDAYDGEGWGLCFDGEHLVMSNGTDELTFRDPNTLAVERSLVVTHQDHTIDQLNELECVGDQILANVWRTRSIIAIDSSTGAVEGSVDASDLVPLEYRGDTEAVLNGIAYNPATDTYWLTGKRWPVIYEVSFVTA